MAIWACAAPRPPRGGRGAGRKLPIRGGVNEKVQNVHTLRNPSTSEPRAYTVTAPHLGAAGCSIQLQRPINSKSTSVCATGKRILWVTPAYRYRCYLPISCRSPTVAHYVCSSPFPVTKHMSHPGSHACYVSRDVVTPLGRPDPSGVIRLEQAHARAYIYALARSLRGTSISDRLRHIFSW